MSSIRPQDRASLCSFTFADGRRCRMPLSSRHPRLCFYHARKAAQAHPADQFDTDLSFFYSGDCVSAHDLSAAIVRLLPDVTDGQIEPETACALAALSKTLMQTIQLAQHESIRSHCELRPSKVARRAKIPAKQARANTRRINTSISAPR